MTSRHARVRALAKLNLSLKVLHKRTDGFHELRTVFQTLALHDTIEIEYTKARRTAVSIEGGPELPDNLILRAAHLFLDRVGARARVRFRLTKRIPMGGGLGGGSSDAAATLLALPAMAGRRLSMMELMKMGAELGSDVPFFFAGGTALGMGRGEELYPLPEVPAKPVLLVCPGIHVATPEAYRALGRSLTSPGELPKLDIFQSFVWRDGSVSAAENDFEEAVFGQHPRLRTLRRNLEKAGARPARMSGSGSTLFGVFPSEAELRAAASRFSIGQLKVISTRMVTRARYRAMWLRSLREHIDGLTWPPQSRY